MQLKSNNLAYMIIFLIVLDIFNSIAKCHQPQRDTFVLTVLYLRINDEVCGNAMLLQIRVPALSFSRLHFVGPLQMFQRHRGDVNPAGEDRQDRELFSNNTRQAQEILHPLGQPTQSGR